VSSYCKKVKQLNYESLIEDVDIVLLNSINSYNANKKTKVSSWVGNMSRFHVLNTIKNLTESGRFVSTENADLDILNNFYNKFHIDENKDLREHIFNLIDNIKDKRARKIFELRFFSDKESSKWKNIAKEMKLSYQQISQIYNSAKEILCDKMNKNQP
jgi:DNA-directed RNA polymerase specialized sigma subunit